MIASYFSWHYFSFLCRFLAGLMKNRDGYVSVEMEDVARYLLSQDRADGVLISRETVSRK